MKNLYFCFLLLLSLPALGQYSSEKSNAIRISSAYGGYSGLELNLGYERYLAPKHSLTGSVFYNYGGYGFNLGYKYNLITVWRFEGLIGLDFRSEYIKRNLNTGQNKINYRSIEPTAELRFDINKSSFINTGINLVPLYKSHSSEESYFLNRINIGFSKRF